MVERVSQELEKYLRAVGTYENEFAKWQARVKKLVKRYRDDTRGSGGNETAKFNILWSNVQTLIPAVYAKLPKADVQRRFGDNDPVGRVAAGLVEQALVEEGRVPPLRAHHKCGHVGQSRLQRHHHQLAHQPDVVASRQMGLGRLIEADGCQLGLHGFQPGHLQLDRTDRLEILVELLPIGYRQLPLQRASVFQHQARHLPKAVGFRG